MEKLKINHESKNLIESFISEDKIERIYEGLVQILHNEQKLSNAIEKAIYAYSDSVEESIGIALLVKKMVEMAMKKSNTSSNALKKVFDEVFGNSEEDDESPRKSFQERIAEKIAEATSKKRSSLDVDKAAYDTAIKMDADDLEEYLAQSDCKSCSSDGDCGIQKAATERGITW